MKYTGVVFDFNGTLFWDTPFHNKAWDIIFDRYNIILNDDDKFKKMHGKNNKDIIMDLFNHPSESQMKALSFEKERIYQQICLKESLHLAPGAPQFLDFLSNNHIPFTIATASEKINIDFYFDILSLSKWFSPDRIVYNDGTVNSKPDPQIYCKAMDLIGCSCAKVVVFEDAIAGLCAAKNAHAGKIIIVDSNNDDYSLWDGYLKIHNFDEVSRNLFEMQ